MTQSFGSPLCHVTEAAGSFALSETSRRPLVLAAHSVPVFCGARASAATKSPATASAPYAVPPMLVAPGGPIRCASPHVGGVTGIVKSRQCASRNAGSPPQSCVLHTDCEPSKIEPANVFVGSGISGG